MNKDNLLKLFAKILLITLLPGTTLVATATEPRVVASIKPIHSLVAGVMEGVNEPYLLIKGGSSPHGYHLRPSEAQAIAKADVVFWIGATLESFLVKPIDNAKKTVRTVPLLDAPDITLLSLREGGAWETHHHDGHESSHDMQKKHAEHEDGHHHKKGKHAEHDNDHEGGHEQDAHAHRPDTDPHIWLDPLNAIAITRQIISVLSEIDPGHKNQYEQNGARLIQRLESLHKQLVTQLVPVQQKSYIIFHDAYQYFEQRYNLNAAGSVVLNPEQQPSVRRVKEIRNRIQRLKVHCVFSEPQFKPHLVKTVIADSGANTGVLDPLGASLKAGPNSYFQLMQQLARTLYICLDK
ncbi:MAG: zinc ABC transporter substrate-binding protein [Candidatus Contendobacter odensis]|uniref:High-affinity zinc uptake system protein ZnuA n=1 Tax=Candidatus Contendibacter odensensis TaxID=1400860 RepID=A0A2G6PGC8_9GAMM|nr:MAG: zinc ABC transporter substrate-binding protein [Candidatus Contendobacter odensis]